MAKTNSKSRSVAVNPRSRAAKRATSPSINTDKSVKEIPRARGTSPVLGLSRNSGVAKRKKGKQMTRGQRERQEKGLARAEIVMDQMHKKVGSATAKLKNRQQRKGQWEDINQAAAEEQRKVPKISNGFATLEAVGEQTTAQNQGDVEMESSTALSPNTKHVKSLDSPHNDADIGNMEPANLDKDEYELIT